MREELNSMDKITSLMRETSCARETAERWLKLMNHNYEMAKKQILLIQEQNKFEKSLPAENKNVKCDEPIILKGITKLLKYIGMDNTQENINYFANMILNNDEEAPKSAPINTINEHKKPTSFMGMLKEPNKIVSEKSKLLMEMVKSPHFDKYVTDTLTASSLEEREMITKNFILSLSNEGKETNCSMECKNEVLPPVSEVQNYNFSEEAKNTIHRLNKILNNEKVENAKTITNEPHMLESAIFVCSNDSSAFRFVVPLTQRQFPNYKVVPVTITGDKYSFNAKNHMMVFVPSYNNKFTQHMYGLLVSFICLNEPVYILTEDLTFKRIFDTKDVEVMSDIEDAIAVQKGF